MAFRFGAPFPKMRFSISGLMLLSVCSLPVLSVAEDTVGQCISDVLCKEQESFSILNSMLQGRKIGSGLDIPKEGTLTMTAAVRPRKAAGHPQAAGFDILHVSQSGLNDSVFLLNDSVVPALEAGLNDSVFILNDSVVPTLEAGYEAYMKTRDTDTGLAVLISALSVFGAIAAAETLVFILCKGAFPMVYAHNAITGKAPVNNLTRLGGFKWAVVAWRLTTEDAVKYIGLDGAMFLEFLNMAIRVCFVIGLPMAIIVGPMNAFLGGGKEKDPLFKAGEWNIGNRGQWLYWRESLIVWYVVLVVHFFVDQSHKKFKQLRAKWLQDLPSPQSHTILIQNLHEEFCSDDALKGYMTKLFAEDAIESAFVVRTMDDQDAPFTKSGFVTFRKRRDMELALGIRLDDSVDDDVNVVIAAPAPADVVYEVLQQEGVNPIEREREGRGMIIVLFIIYLPLVFLAALVTSLDTLVQWSPWFDRFCKESPSFVSLWEGTIGPAVLTLLPGFVPSILMMIIQGHYALPSVSGCQHVLERWYLYFQVTFTLVIFSFSTTLFEVYSTLLDNPGSALAELIPKLLLHSVSFFYLSLIAADVATHTFALTRVWNLLKFIWYKQNNGEEEAYMLSEPEDQDYQGIGSRSARLVLILITTLVYGTIETYVTLMALLDFFVCRVVYSYLMVFAESRKQDSGGQIWISMVKQVQFGLFLYVSLMTAIIFKKSTAKHQHNGPGYLALIAFFLLYNFHMEDRECNRLTLEEVVHLDMHDKQPQLSGSYSHTDPHTAHEQLES